MKKLKSKLCISDTLATLSISANPISYIVDISELFTIILDILPISLSYTPMNYQTLTNSGKLYSISLIFTYIFNLYFHIPDFYNLHSNIIVRNKPATELVVNVRLQKGGLGFN